MFSNYFKIELNRHDVKYELKYDNKFILGTDLNSRIKI